MNVTEKAAASTCVIEIAEGNHRGFGCGVFIGEDTVLTAWHVLEGSDSQIFIGADGNASRRKPGSQIYRSNLHDAAIVKLERPIGRHYLRVIDTEAARQADNEGWLVSRFNSKFESQKISFNPLMNPVSVRPNDSPEKLAVFFNCASSQGIRRGYSGAPIINRQGKIISLLSTGLFKGANPPMDQYTKTFTGPSPLRLAQFVEGAKL